MSATSAAKVVATARGFCAAAGEHQRRIRAAGHELVLAARDHPLGADELTGALRDADAAILGLDDCGASVLRSCPRLRVVSRYGVGVDNVDLAVARELGIAVTNTPGANTIAVAELAIALMLSLARNVPDAVQGARAGAWTRHRGWELAGKVLGIVGYGQIGRAVARRAEAFDMHVVATDPYAPPDDGTAALRLADLLQEADVVTLHLGLTDETRHLIDRAAMARMKPSAILINAARGGLVDEAALADALRDGRIAGAAADAFEHEPPHASPLVSLPTFLPTPHMGAATEEATARMGLMAAQNALDVLEGRTPNHVVVPPDPKRRTA